MIALRTASLAVLIAACTCGAGPQLTNANARRMGMTQLLVRRVAKATRVALLTAISHDLLAHATTLLA